MIIIIIIKHQQFMYEISLWQRYVDDTIVALDDSLLEDFTNHINTIHPSIKFTREEKENNTIPMLDAKTTRDTAVKLHGVQEAYAHRPVPAVRQQPATQPQARCHTDPTPQLWCYLLHRRGQTTRAWTLEESLVSVRLNQNQLGHRLPGETPHCPTGPSTDPPERARHPALRGTCVRRPSQNHQEGRRCSPPEALQQHPLSLGATQGQGSQGGQTRRHLSHQVWRVLGFLCRWDGTTGQGPGRRTP